MRRSLTLLIVMALAGAPASSLACDLWCLAPAAAHHHDVVGCHKAAAAVATAPQMSAIGDCADAVTVSPFLLEERKTDVTRVGTEAATIETPSVANSVEGVIAFWESVVRARPPRGPSFHVILRI